METQNQNYYGSDNLELEAALEENLNEAISINERGILVGPYAEEINAVAAGDQYTVDTAINKISDDIDDGPDEDDDLEDDDLGDDTDDDLGDDLEDDDDLDVFDEPYDIDDDLNTVDKDLDLDDDDDDDFKDDDYAI